MALRDPVAVYVAAHNMEAHLLRTILNEAGIEAFVTEDMSQVGFWMLGVLSQIHRPQVWVEREKKSAAQAVLSEYDRQQAAKRDLPAAALDSGEPIAVVCENCGRSMKFVRALAGSIQLCPQCGKYVDVEPEGYLSSWQSEDEPTDVEPMEGGMIECELVDEDDDDETERK